MFESTSESTSESKECIVWKNNNTTDQTDTPRSHNAIIHCFAQIGATGWCVLFWYVMYVVICLWTQPWIPRSFEMLSYRESLPVSSDGPAADQEKWNPLHACSDAAGSQLAMLQCDLAVFGEHILGSLRHDLSKLLYHLGYGGVSKTLYEVYGKIQLYTATFVGGWMMTVNPILCPLMKCLYVSLRYGVSTLWTNGNKWNTLWYNTGYSFCVEILVCFKDAIAYILDYLKTSTSRSP